MRLGRGVQHIGPFRRDYLGGFDSILIFGCRRRERNEITGPNVAERAKKCIAVPSDADIASAPWKSCAGNMPDAKAQICVVVSFDHNGIELQSRNFESCDGHAVRGRLRRSYDRDGHYRIVLELSGCRFLIEMRLYKDERRVSQGQRTANEKHKLKLLEIRHCFSPSEAGERLEIVWLEKK